MRKALLIALAFLLASVAACAQSFNSVKKDHRMVYAEASAPDAVAADSLALISLADKLALSLDLPYTLDIKREIMRGYIPDLKGISKTVSVAERHSSSVLRYMESSETDKVFDARRRKVQEMLTIADGAEKKRQIDVALRYYSWAETLLQSIPPKDDAKIRSVRAKHDALIAGMKVSFVKQNRYDKGIAEVGFSYNGQPVASVDYKFFDGQKWSGTMSAKDGKGIIEVSPSSDPELWSIAYEIVPSHTRQLFREVAQVESAIGLKAGSIAGTRSAASTKFQERPLGLSEPQKIDYADVKQKVLDIIAQKETEDSADSTSLLAIAPVAYPERFEDNVQRILDGIAAGNRDMPDYFFTGNGHEVFRQLVGYGNARVLADPSLQFYGLGEDIFCRKIPMSFSFDNGRNTFVEDLVFTLDKGGKVSNVSFALTKDAVSDILVHENWSEEARVILITFLENYKTAYALKRLDYISSIFDDDALIITGNVLKTVGQTSEFGKNRYVTLTKQTKAAYIKRLEKVFEAQEFINLQFSDCEVLKFGKGEQLFGIKLRQEYFSQTYSDSGYLFIMVDLSDYNQPLIHVRTWQEEPDKDFGVIGPYHF